MSTQSFYNWITAYASTTSVSDPTSSVFMVDVLCWHWHTSTNDGADATRDKFELILGDIIKFLFW